MLRFPLAKHFPAQASDWLKSKALVIQMIQVIVARRTSHAGWIEPEGITKVIRGDQVSFGVFVKT